MSRLSEPLVSFEDPLALLPRKPIQQFARNRVIYDQQRPADGLYVVVAGRVKIFHSANDGSETIVRIVNADGIFGESALLRTSATHESAVSLESVKVMTWSSAEIEGHIQREPRLGVALVQYMVRQCLLMQERIQCMAICKTPERVALALVQLADATGQTPEQGVVRMGGLTHHTLADYVGTSREIVTFQLNRLRRLGLVKYTRKHIEVYRSGLLARVHERNAAVSTSTEQMESAAAVR
jgi:CRP/FNR family transcriptional regulator, cyclic AMP receptor protein